MRDVASESDIGHGQVEGLQAGFVQVDVLAMAGVDSHHGAFVPEASRVERRTAECLGKVRREPLVVTRVRAALERMPGQRVLPQPRVPGLAECENPVEPAGVFIQAHAAILQPGAVQRHATHNQRLRIAAR